MAGGVMAVPGHCISIDGEWWHDPGSCPGAREGCDGKCCTAAEGEPPQEAAPVVLGQRVRFGNVLHRRKSGEGGVYEKSWERLPGSGGEGVVVGLRRLQNGYANWGDYETTWHQTESVPAVLVAVSLHRKPILVHREDVRPIEAGS